MPTANPPIWTSPKRIPRAVLAASPVDTAVRSRALRENPLTAPTCHALGADDEDFDAWIVVRQGDFLRQVDLLRRPPWHAACKGTRVPFNEHLTRDLPS